MKKFFVLFCIFSLVFTTIRFVPLRAEASEHELPDGGSSSWQHYNKVYGYTTRGANGKASVTCQLTAFNSGYTTVYNYVTVNVTQATVDSSASLHYHSVSENVDRTVTSNANVSLGNNYSTHITLSNQNDYNNYGQQNYIGAKAINEVSYTYYGHWYSKNYIGSWF